MSERGFFCKKPIVIEAVQWTGNNPNDVKALRGGAEQRFEFHGATLRIPTLEGTMEATPGDWIIRGVKGEFYPCKPGIFEATYERVDGVSASR